MERCIKCNNENPNVTYVPANTPDAALIDEHLVYECKCGRKWATICADSKRKKKEVFLDVK